MSLRCERDEAREAQNAWDRFLQKHEDELVNLRRISKERKAEVAELNQKLAEQQEFARTYKEWWQQSEANESHLENKLSKAKWVEDSLRFSIDILKQQHSNNPMREIRQAHQEADQWQRRYEEAQEKLEALTDFLNGLRDELQFHADDVGSVMADHDLGASGFEPQFKPVYKTFINGEEIDAATDRHWRERDK